MKASVVTLRQAREVRDLFRPIAGRLADVERFLEREMEAAMPMVRETAGWVLGSGGKRLRPALVLLISRMLGYVGERDVRYGAVVELIHTATLIHDDIIDGSDLRRGRATANRRWGDQAAVLVGDWLYTRTMDLCLELGDVEVMRRLTWATLQMTEGEILADRVRGRLDIDEVTYMDITRRKTAELFAAACAVPALFQASTHHMVDRLLEFGRGVGICFQLVDDLLDYSASRHEMGKPVMADLREGRVTLPMILLLPRLDARHRVIAERAATCGEMSAEDEADLVEVVRTSGVLETVRERAKGFAERAGEAAAALPAGTEREALIRAAKLLLDRRA